jgi:uncharacterized protein YbaR (Trm112 family)
MGKFKNTLMDILACDLCYGKGWLYVGNNEDFDVYTCDCNLYSVPSDEIMEYHQLFKTKENA